MIPAGWKIVPIEPTKTMLVFGENAMHRASHGDFVATEGELESMWSAMLDAAPEAPNAQSAWQPIETAPKDGRTLLLGYANSHGRWRTLRGQWFSREVINDEWENGDECSEGWYETPVEGDEERVWKTEPTHWMTLPSAPTAQTSANASHLNPEDAPKTKAPPITPESGAPFCDAELPPLPLAYEYIYEFADGARKLSPSMRNGSHPTRSETVYTADQMRTYARAAQALARRIEGD